MANYYTMLSFTIENLTNDEIDWLAGVIGEGYFSEAGLAQFCDDGELAAEVGFGCEVELDEGRRSLWITHDESANPNDAASFVQEFLLRFRPQDVVSFEWADTCSNPRADAYGGGACVVTALGYEMFHTSMWVQRKLTEINTAKEH